MKNFALRPIIPIVVRFARLNTPYAIAYFSHSPLALVLHCSFKQTLGAHEQHQHHDDERNGEFIFVADAKLA